MSNLGPALRETAQAHRVEERSEQSVQLIETHISWVLLAGDCAWKIKKPVRLEFADFSTLQRRRHFCEEELRLNRRLAPELYLGVVPITASERSPILEGDGPPIDFAVKMRRFPQKQLLSDVLDRGELRLHHIDDLAATVARFHQQIDVAAPSSEFGSPQSTWQPVQANFNHFSQHITDQTRRDRLTTIRRRMTQIWTSLAEECSARRTGGFVRECHGDMHLGNMVLLDRQVTIFDGIDFNPAFRWIDVINEVAFVVMDLERRGRRDLAYRFLNRYCELTGDYDGVRLLPFYVAYRALVRAKVRAIRFEQQVDGSMPTDSEQREFDSLLQLAAAYTAPPERHLFITHGLSGSGKTTITQTILECLGAIRIRSDIERRRLTAHGAPPTDRYSEDAKDRTYDWLEQLAGQLLGSGLPVIVDATFLKRQHRDQFRDIARQHQARFTILDCTAPVALLEARIRQRQRAGQDASEADNGVLHQQMEAQTPLSDDERKTVVEIDAAQPAEVVSRAVARHFS